MNLPTVTILQGDCREVLRTLPDESIQCCVTSPPYWGLRDYGHADQLGAETTPQEYVATMVSVFAEVWRVLKPDGTLWLNLGDSYAGSGRGGNPEAGTKQGTNAGSQTVGVLYGREQESREAERARIRQQFSAQAAMGLKPKDLVGIPWRVAFALQAAGWYLRSDIIWHKPNPMPESVTDRPTKAHEYIFLLTKSASYYYDHEAIKEPSGGWNGSEFHDGKNLINHPNVGKVRAPRASGNRTHKFTAAYDLSDTEEHRTKAGLIAISDKVFETRNKRSVWTVGTQPFGEAHFATFPPDLIRPCIRAGCPVGGMVLDPFGGSGTTAMVAIWEARSATLIELNPDYIEMMKGRTSVSPGLGI